MLLFGQHTPRRVTRGLVPIIGAWLSFTAAASADDVRVSGDSCPNDYRAITPKEAQAASVELCGLLEPWDIARLGNGGSMDGPGYGCGIRDEDSRSLGHALCRDAIEGADPSVIRRGSDYISVEAHHGTSISIRIAPSTGELADAPAQRILGSGYSQVWAPEIVYYYDGNFGRYYIYFAAEVEGGHRMFVMSSKSAATGYGEPQQMNLPGDKWAIDGTMFAYGGELWFVWSGWEGDKNVEQNLYLAKMVNPTSVENARHIISQPREPWEQHTACVDVPGTPCVNEGPQPILDPDGQLHIVYSANGSWDAAYCLADLRLKPNGDPTHVWDWYKSNGCLFGSEAPTVMAGTDTTQYSDGTGHHSFVLVDGDIATSPPAGQPFPLMYHAVPKGTPYQWDKRSWYRGSFVWWGNTVYARGTDSDTGWSLKFFE